jgi:AsmA protein
MRAAKIFAWVLGGLIALVAVLLIGVKLFVNPNNYKDRIAAAVKESTGRELKLPGDIKLSVFPWVALELGPASLGNPPGFGDEPFMTLQHVAVRVKVMPLLRKQLEVSKVELDGLDLRLHKNAAGQGNWQMKEEDQQKSTQTPAEGESSAQLKSIGGISVTHGRIAYDNNVIENFELETGSIASRSDVPVSIQFDANRGVIGEQVGFKGKFTASPDTDTEQYRLSGLNFAGTVSTVGEAQPVHYEVDIPKLAADLKQQTLDVPEFALSLAGAKVTGKLAGTKITDDLHLTGTVKLAPVALRELAPRLGIDLPKTQDPKALSALSMSTNFSYDAQGASLDDLMVKLDDTELKGSLKYAGGKGGSAKFDLAADKIDLDRYRPPESSTPPPKTAAAEQPKPKKGGAEPMSLQGTFTLGDAKVAGLDFTNIKAVLDDKDNVAHLNPTEAQIYGGKYTGDVTYDQSKATPAMALDVHLIGVDSAQAVANSKAKGRISGKANVNLKATAQGVAAADIMKTLNGQFDANLTDGALEGLDLGYEIAMAQALIAKQTSTTVPNEHKTKFTSFKLSAPIVNGVATTKDLSIVSNIIKVSGQGSINLPTTDIDMNLVASVLKSGGATTAAEVPMKVTGKYTDPSVKPDIEGLAKGAVKQKLQDALKKNGVKGLQDLFKH